MAVPVNYAVSLRIEVVFWGTTQRKEVPDNQQLLLNIYDIASSIEVIIQIVLSSKVHCRCPRPDIETESTTCLLYQPRMVMNDDECGAWQGKPKYWEKTCPSAALSTVNPT
jgi:hypothetical protein